MRKLLFVFFIFIITPTFAFASDQVEINTASLQQLEEIIGVGPVLAQRIIDDRPFSSIDDLLRVKGIGEKTLQKIKAQGLAYVAGQIQQPAQETGPTPKLETTPTLTLIPNPTPISSPISVPVIAYPSGIFINEILPAPEGPDETNEWIELYNSNNFNVDLSDWKIQDIKGTTITYVFPQNTNILNNGYLILKRPETKITLNNDEDGFNLILPDGKIIDSFSYVNAPKNQSYNKINSSYGWSKNLTPGTANIIATDIPQEKVETLPKAQKSDNRTTVASAAISAPANSLINNFSQKLNPLFLFLSAAALIIISAIIILILKFKTSKKNNNTN